MFQSRGEFYNACSLNYFIFPTIAWQSVHNFFLLLTPQGSLKLQDLKLQNFAYDNKMLEYLWDKEADEFHKQQYTVLHHRCQIL